MLDFARVVIPIAAGLAAAYFISASISWLLAPGTIKVDRNWLIVEYGRAMRVFTLLFFAFSAFLLYASLVKAVALAIVISGSLFLVASICVLEAFRHKLWFDSETIYYQPPYWRRTKLDFSSVKQCKVVRGGNEYRIVGMGGEKIGFTPYMSGARELFEAIGSYLATRDSQQ